LEEAIMTMVLYFAYGSNLDEAQMRERCPAAERVARATLRGHVLTFGGFSHKWNGAVASVRRAPSRPTGRAGPTPRSRARAVPTRRGRSISG
ncbi:MAG: gamma-glutamylcyclotransferase family protein, partial [Gemmatimonadales bacterium]